MSDPSNGFSSTATAFRSGEATLDDVLTAIRSSLFYARRPERPGLFIFDLGERGRWTSVFTSPESLARHVVAQGETAAIDYFSTNGADLLDNLLPPAVGLLIDPDDDHALALSPTWLNHARPDTSRTVEADAADQD